MDLTDMDSEIVKSAESRWRSIVEQFTRLPTAASLPCSLERAAMIETPEETFTAAAMKWYAARRQKFSVVGQVRRAEQYQGPRAARVQREAASRLDVAARVEREVTRDLTLLCEKKATAERQESEGPAGAHTQEAEEQSAGNVGMARVCDTHAEIPINEPIKPVIECS